MESGNCVVSNYEVTERMVSQAIELEWPTSNCIFLTIDFECDYGTALEENTYQALAHTEQLVSLLETLDIPLTCFIQTEVLEKRPEQVEKLRTARTNISFHPHSHTHKHRERSNIEFEIRKSRNAFEEYFDYQPTGYRFPNGNIRPNDLKTLSKYGYKFDASVFPSWRPGHFDNRKAALTPEFHPPLELFEIPFTVYSERIRVPTALSFCRLLGRPFTELLIRRPPSNVIFNIHMHDLVNPRTYDELPPQYKAIYARNNRGMMILQNVLERFDAAGYSFGTIDDVVEGLANNQSLHT